jgi:hypothetical protein
MRTIVNLSLALPLSLHRSAQQIVPRWLLALRWR